jgi:hypothetical protein
MDGKRVTILNIEHEAVPGLVIAKDPGETEEIESAAGGEARFYAFHSTTIRNSRRRRQRGA